MIANFQIAEKFLIADFFSGSRRLPLFAYIFSGIFTYLVGFSNLYFFLQILICK